MINSWIPNPAVALQLREFWHSTATTSNLYGICATGAHIARCPNSYSSNQGGWGSPCFLELSYQIWPLLYNCDYMKARRRENLAPLIWSKLANEFAQGFPEFLILLDIPSKVTSRPESRQITSSTNLRQTYILATSTKAAYPPQ